MKRRGFTLVEIAAVVVIVGLLASAATVSVVRMSRTVSLEESLRSIIDFDMAARLLSERDGESVSLKIDSRRRVIVRTSAAGERRLTLPGEIELRPARMSPNTVTLRDGIGETYAVHVRADEGEATLLFAGVGGQVTRLEQEADVDAIFAHLLAK